MSAYTKRLREQAKAKIKRHWSEKESPSVLRHIKSSDGKIKKLSKPLAINDFIARKNSEILKETPNVEPS